MIMAEMAAFDNIRELTEDGSGAERDRLGGIRIRQCGDAMCPSQAKRLRRVFFSSTADPCRFARQRRHGQQGPLAAQPLRTPVAQFGPAAALALTATIMLGWLVFGYLKFAR